MQHPVGQPHLHQLQHLQNVAACLLSNTSKYSRINPILQNICWLMIAFRIKSKVLHFVFKAISGLRVVYLTELVPVYHPIKSLRSALKEILVIPRSQSGAIKHFLQML